ncbi:MAG TPA: efflux RND transporter permease subunit, partial [Aminivibrio sp.]|uniref:efflux RND transporter permease subunit n=1 Tax=Aminivibrio sp. TaxID=1872489 RepID=UPI002C3EC947
QGTDEVAFSVIAGGLTTVAVFAPITFMGGIIGKFFFSFGITVVCTIVISVLLSLSLTPFISSRIMRTEESGLLPARMIRSFLVSLENGYRRLLAMAVRFRWITLGGALGFFVLGLFFAANLGTSFFPSEDRGELTLSFELADGTALDESERFLARLDGIVRERKDVDYTYGTVAGGTGSEANKGSLYLSFVPRGERASLGEIKKELRREFDRFPDAILSIAERGGSDITMNLSGGDIVQLGTTAAGILAELEGDARLTDVDTDVRLEKPQLNIRLNRARADDLDLDVRSLSEEISAYFGGLKAGVFKDGGYRYDIRLMAEDSLRTSGDDIEKISVFSGSGESVPLAGLVGVKRELAPNVVKRLNRQPSIEISANVSGISSGEGMAIISAAASKHLPADGSVSFGPSGQSQNMQEDFRRIFTAMATVVLLVYMVMAIQFESFMHPFTIMFCLPLLMPGAFGMLYLAGKSLDMMAFIGIILLVGIVVNNGIILVDFINQERKRGVPKAEAVVNAGPLRLRAILMTAFSTIVGAIPVALGISEGAELRQPMAIATVGGLATSTLLTLFVIPVVYLVLDDLKEKSASLVRWMRMGRTRRSVRGALEAAENIGGKS